MTEHTTPEPSQEIPCGYCQCGCGQKTKLASRNRQSAGWVKGKPLAFLSGHGAPTAQPDTVKFWKYVHRAGPAECWLWTGPKNGAGYGTMMAGSRRAGNHRTMGAHRFSYELHHGPIPDGMYVCHSCDTPLCVNPAHLSLGTPAENMTDKVGKKRHNFGSTHGRSKLTEQDIRAIRDALNAGESRKEVAERFSISHATISLIVRGKIWKHVP